MIKTFTRKLAFCIALIMAFCGRVALFAQQSGSVLRKDSTTIKYPFTLDRSNNVKALSGDFTPDPPNLVRTIEYDAATNRYILTEKVGNMLYRPIQYLTFSQYLALKEQEEQRAYWRKLADNYAYASQQPGFIPQIKVKSQTFEKIFGSDIIDIRPQGSAEMVFAGQINKNQNPLFNTTQRTQYNFNFDQHIQMNLTGDIGDKLKINTNYNTDAQFQFENQVKLDYTGKPDEIIQKIEAGTVSMPLNTTLITGSQALFGLKTKLKFGKLEMTSIFSQQRSQSQQINITNGSQTGTFKLSASDYEANKHYFLSQYFHDNYNKAQANIPIISSNVNITKIEVWITNTANSTTDSRDILAFMDLGENKPYNTTLIQGGAGYSGLPAGFNGAAGTFTQQSNNLLANLPATARQTSSNSVATYFQATGATDNYAKLTYARKLTNKEYTLNAQLGYISLTSPLNNNEVLAVAYQYSYNGVVYQVGEFSTDVPVDPVNAKVLYTKLLKNEILKPRLPTWNLMMKNIYNLGQAGISQSNFNLSITRLDNTSGIEKPLMEEGQNIKGKLWLQVMGLDNLNQAGAKEPDGYFDFLEGVTIDSQNGRIIFPMLEPFGADLNAKFTAAEQATIGKTYVYQPLYDSIKTTAQQYFPQFNRFVIKGTFTSSHAGSEYQLNAGNIPQGSVTVTAGGQKLTENSDFTVDYNAGHVTILNQALLASGQPITINVENNALFGVQQKSLYGTRFDYNMSDQFHLGATVMHLSEQPLTQNIAIGDEPVSNTIYGFDVNYHANSRLLTRLVDNIPFIHTKAPSSVTFSGEFAKLVPGHPSALNFAGANGTSYLDDFENTSSVIDLKSANTWQISGTPQLFPEAQLSNDLSYGFNRARLAFYNIDPIFYNGSPPPLTNASTELSNHYVRQVFEQEVFPYKQSITGSPLPIPTLDLAYYPTVRGPYNFTTTGLNADGTLLNPRTRWGGMFRSINSTDFEALNVQYIEFWVMDPFIYNKNSTAGGDLYFDLGSISEDILKDGRKSLENGLPVDGDLTKVDTTVWGRVPKLQPVVSSFDNNSSSRALQDIGLDGLNDADERVKYASIVAKMKASLSAQAGNDFATDPSGDDFQYYRTPTLDAAKAGILQRYAKYNGTEGNSMTSDQSQAELGIQTSASTSLPDGEDINRDNTMSIADEYFEYKVSMRPADLVVGQNFIADKITASVKLVNGQTQNVNYYQFRIPIHSYVSNVGNIQDFKSIGFVRMFMTNFADTTVLRFPTLQLVRGDWRSFNTENNPLNVIADPAVGTNPPLDNSSLNVATVNIEQNGNRVPIPYVLPPGIQRQKDYNNLATNTQLNEQSLSVTVNNLRNGYSRAAFKTFSNDLRKYKHISMFVHAEALTGQQLKDNDISAFIRMGIDYVDNYYEYVIPLKITQTGTTDAGGIWPTANNLDIDLSRLTDAKIHRNNALLNGKAWPTTVPYTYNGVTIKGQPDISQVATIMLGVRNPYLTNGTDKSAIVWFDELRLTDFDQSGGWAATGRLNAKLADFADVTISGTKTTAGFGGIDQTVSNQSLTSTSTYDISTNMELGKFFPAKTGLHIPVYVDVSSQTSTPVYDPAAPDLKLADEMAAATTKAARDSVAAIQSEALDVTTRKSINFTNVRKTKTDPKATPHLWDVENLSASYAYTEIDHHDFTTQDALQKTYNATLAYNYNSQPKYYAPFSKIIKNNMLALLRDFNYSLLPSRLNFSINFNRFYSENTLRNNDPNNSIPLNADGSNPLTSYNKNFLITRVYGISWNLSKSMTLDIDATNLSTVDEPAGRINGLKVDTLWNNLKSLGRTTDYGHNLNLTYAVPLSKIPGMDWAALQSRYSTRFEWKSAPEFALTDPTLSVGNSIQNSRTIQLNPNLNFGVLYNKFRFLRKSNDPNKKDDGGVTSILLGLLTSIKNASGTYTRTQSTFLPGYLPSTNFYGSDPSYDAPGIGFLLGSQADIRQKALEGGWITKDTLQNQLYVTSLMEHIEYRATIEPFQSLQITLLGTKTRDMNYQTNFKYLSSTNSFQDLSPVTSGDYTVSYLTLATAFSKPSGIDNSSATFQKFLDYRTTISQRLGKLNPNSSGVTGGYADGYGPNSQNVLVASFLAAYAGKDPNKSQLSAFPNIPIPNWDITYKGLSKLPFLSDIFNAFDLRHGYRSAYNVNGFNTLQTYTEANGAVNSRDANGDFLPFYQFSQISITEQFVPLLGVDMRFKNDVTANFEYRQSRAISLSLANSQLGLTNESNFVFGFGYHTNHFRFPFGMFNNLVLDNDLNFKLDFSINTNETFIYQSDVTGGEVSSGSNNLAVRPSIDYALNKRFTMRLFYDSTITKPYTSQSFETSFANFGFSLKLMLQ